MWGCHADSNGAPAVYAPPATAPAKALDSEKPVAFINGEAVGSAELNRKLRETAGAVVLEEFVLDRALDTECRSRGISISKDDIEAERALLFSNISASAEVSAEQTGALLDRFRRARGLGPSRFEALLARSARLRALTRAEGTVSEHDVHAGLERDLSAKALARILVCSSRPQAASALEQLSAATSGPARSAKFAELAFTESSDPSSVRGGLFGPVSPSDPGLPALVRGFLTGEPGALSPILSLENGFAIVLVEQQTPAKPMPEGAALDAAMAKCRTRLEREAMDRVAASLIAKSSCLVTDDALKWSWDSRPAK